MADIRVSIVWIPMLVDDSEAAARRSAQLLAEPRVRQFYDARQEVGRVVADSLGAAGEIAWDTYLFYRPGSIWNVDPPAPDTWMHQLSAKWAPPSHLRRGDALPQALHAVTEQGRTGAPPASGEDPAF
ncbi:MAG TPA: hypothetical protein VLA19_12860 [Herpetosiphonaceae bacterium]|nr:hypothetical protein [Herpetosiphonaceae bacterium]